MGFGGDKNGRVGWRLSGGAELALTNLLRPDDGFSRKGLLRRLGGCVAVGIEFLKSAPMRNA